VIIRTSPSCNAVFLSPPLIAREPTVFLKVIAELIVTWGTMLQAGKRRKHSDHAKELDLWPLGMLSSLGACRPFVRSPDWKEWHTPEVALILQQTLSYSFSGGDSGMVNN
jgi:hypothetical protein